MSTIFEQCRIMPVITPYNVESTVGLIRCLVDAGINAVEITLRTDCALDALQAVIDDFKESDSNVLIGVGTTNSAKDFETVAAMGVDFAISPGISKALLEAAKDSEVPLLPGISSPSEILLGLEYGQTHFKLFPAEVSGGVAMLKALGGPFPKLRFCPTGGVNLKNAPEYLVLDNVFCIGGTWMLPKDAILEGRWDEIKSLTQQALNL